MQADAVEKADGTASAVTRPDVKLVVRSAALFLAPFETLLRQIEPAITLGQLTALDIVVHSGSVRPFRLGQQMMISRQLAWQTCKRLESLGLVTMVERDGQNSVDVLPTEKGVAHLQSVAAVYEALAGRLMALDRPIDVSPAKAALVALGTAAASMCQPDRPANARPGVAHSGAAAEQK